MCAGVNPFGSFGASDALQLGTSAASLFAAKATGDAQKAQGASARAYGATHDAMAQSDALQEEDAAKAQAEKILRAARKQKGAARAATAASGARLDEFATGAENEIEQLAQEDAAMTILSGKRRADSIRRSGEFARTAGENEAAASRTRANTTMFQGFSSAARGLEGWKGMKSAPEVADDGYSIGQGGAYGGRRKGL